MKGQMYKAAATAALVLLFIIWMELVALLIVGMARLVIWLAGVTW